MGSAGEGDAEGTLGGGDDRLEGMLEGVDARVDRDEATLEDEDEDDRGP